MRYFYLFAVLLFSAASSFAQGASNTGGNIDVYNYQIFWRINPDSGTTTTRGIEGVVKVKFATKVAGVSSITLDLSSKMTLVEVLHGAISIKAGSSITADILTIPLGVTLGAAGTLDSVEISYKGRPTKSTPLGGGIGYQKTTDANGDNYIYTLAESFEDRDWWPCKADMKDKADTIDITVNVPWLKGGSTGDTFWVACPGRLVDSSINAVNKSRTFVFQNRYPMASYLVSVCVARFMRYYRGTVSVGGFNVPIVYYLTPRASNATTIANMDKVMELVQGFGTKYGNYGWIDPVRGGKAGFYEGLGTNGGMEHQTFSGISTNSINSKSILAHELAHQWFGDKVSFSSWGDLWLAEGFANYSESLAPELVSGMGYSSFSSRNGYKSTNMTNAIGMTGTSVFIPGNPTTSDQIWPTNYGSSVYVRGGVVVSMLRTLAGDAKFFQALQNYQTDPLLQYKSATTADLRDHFNTVLGLTSPNDLTEFFNDYVNGTGNPTYNIGYQTFGAGSKSLAITVAGQGKSGGSSVSYFNTPVYIHAQNKTGSTVNKDTVIVFYDFGGGKLAKAGMATGMGPVTSGNTLTYNLSFVANNFVGDDSARTMISSTTFSALSIVDLKILNFTARQHNTYNDASLLLDDNSINADVILERSADGGKFFDLGSMTLQASASTTKKYLFNDMSPLTGDNYYRAKYKNADGVFIYSKIVKLSSSTTSQTGYMIINNPVSDMLQIKTSEAAGKNITFNLYELTGKQILSKQVSNAGNITDIVLPAGITPGMYVVKITAAGEETQNLKFMVK